MENCIFCKIVLGSIPSQKVYEDDHVLAFNDIDAKAPVHVLIIPKTHFDSIMDITGEHSQAIILMQSAAAQIAKNLGVDKTGFRLVINTGSDGGQSVSHIHMHLMGGRQMQWPPG